MQEHRVLELASLYLAKANIHIFGSTDVSRSKNSTSIPKILQDGIEITGPEAISNVFNQHFTEIGPIS